MLACSSNVLTTYSVTISRFLRESGVPMYLAWAAAVMAFASLILGRWAISREDKFLASNESADATEPTRPGAFWIRYSALQTDFLILSLLAALLIYQGSILRVATLPIAVLIPPAYFSILTALTGQTWGKRLAALVVQRADGRRAGFVRSVMRFIISAVFGLLFQYLIGYIDPLCAASGRKRRTIHDYLAGTRVMTTGRRASPLLPAFSAFGVIGPLLLVVFVLRVFSIPSSAMCPTIMEGDRLAVNQLAYIAHPPRHGDIVVFRAPGEWTSGKEVYMIKRIVAVSGDTVEVRGDSLHRNGKVLAEPYLLEPGQTGYDMYPVKIPKGKLFVLGDNRNDSDDSHRHGPLDEDRVIGQAEFRFWPLDRVASLQEGD